MKKVIFFTSLIIIFFLILTLVHFNRDQARPSSNPYGNLKISDASKKLLKDKNYDNVILPKELKQIKSTSGYVYFFSPLCIHCRYFTPLVNNTFNHQNIKIKKFNIYEFKDLAKTYNIQETPTVIYYKNGKEVKKIVGETDGKSLLKWIKS
ncbi:thioredoxin family protein [Rummeliibacillus suwonensis]|uniref:thioredoxin family protein n=1 Tax=Rummeliibacillus suwonensis TaxID=1306154 RepID=UPI0011B79CB0|nr:thioredoxin family protein [Rummeliibacillus suwonensis]